MHLWFMLLGMRLSLFTFINLFDLKLLNNYADRSNLTELICIWLKCGKHCTRVLEFKKLY